MSRSVDYIDGKVVMINQTLLPKELVYISLGDVQGIADAIRDMLVRGAPAIGAAGALGMVLAARSNAGSSVDTLIQNLREAQSLLNSTRPTAVNLFWGTQRMLDEALAAAQSGSRAAEIVNRLEDLGRLMLREDEEVNMALGKNGASLLQDNSGVLTHCNAGALACVGYGTALGVVRAAVESGKTIRVYADETRPRLQGMKLTCYELMRDGIDVTLIADSMAAMLMREGKIQAVVVGADRIAANGDTANKIGTYSVAVLAKYHNIPFYVAAPTSTIDAKLSDGSKIPIEERSPEEMTHIDQIRIAPENVKVINPAFDITPAELISAIITEKEIAYPPYNWI